MNNFLKRTLSFALALVMILTLAPVSGIHAHATEAEPVVAETDELVSETEAPAEETVENPEEETCETSEELDNTVSVLVDDVSDADDLTLADHDITLTVTELLLESGGTPKGGSVTWKTDGADTVTGNATGYGSGMLAKIVKRTLVIKNGSETAKTLIFDFVLTGGGSVEISGQQLNGKTEGKVSADLAGGESVEITLISPEGEVTNTLILSNILLTSSGTVTTTFMAPVNGSYSVDGVAITEETKVEKDSTESYNLKAVPAEGFVFFGWYSVAEGKYLSRNAEATLNFGADPWLKPVFISKDTAIFAVGNEQYDNLTDAANAAKDGDHKTIVLLNDGVVSGSHTIPAGTILLIPHNDANTYYGAPKQDAVVLDNCVNKGLNTHVAWEKPSKYRELTLAEGATITVNGTIEVSGMHAAAGAGDPGHGGSPTGELGYIKMEAGSNISLMSGATLLCWGYIYGDGTVTAKSGSSVYENFQIMDFRGGNVTLGLATFEKTPVFPLSQYYVQNVEVATTFEAGSAEYIATSLFAQERCLGAAVKFIGDGAMFQPAADAKVVKEYDPVEDELNVVTYGDCALAPLSIEIAGIIGGNNESGDAAGINSANFVLPITNNINITVKTGTATLRQSIMMLPGSSLTVDEGAALAIEDGYQLQVFDSENWTTGYPMTFGKDLDGNDTMSPGAEMENNLRFCYPNAQFAPISYSPTKEKIRTTEDLTDVTVDINGTIITNGFMYSTVMINIDVESGIPSIGGGANIVSTKQTGTLVMNSGAGMMPATFLYDQSKKSTSEIVSFGGVFYMIPMASAMLKNGDGSFLPTTGAEAGATYKYCKRHDHWAVGECTATTCEITWVGDNNENLGTQEFAIGATPAYTGETPVKEGHTFAGWSTKANGEGDKYPVGEDLPAVAADTTYFAYFTENTTGLKGDVNLDRAVDALDLAIMARVVPGIDDLTSVQAQINADVNEDGLIDAIDLAKFARFVPGIITDWSQD